MSTQTKETTYDSFFLLARRIVILIVIFTVLALAFFRESLPDSLKSATTFFADERSPEDDNLVPHRFRIDKASSIQNSSEVLLFNVENTAINQNDENSTDNEFVQTSHNDYSTEIVALHEELIKIGATSCRLTYWGNSKSMYRFSCQIPVVSQNTGATRQFQSIASNAVESMQDVIQQIRQWQASQRLVP